MIHQKFSKFGITRAGVRATEESLLSTRDFPKESLENLPHCHV
ncbi:hypothetical protein [Helicobacter marmotae]|nr:hypothetical protein [Helicobacter marmotae]